MRPLRVILASLLVNAGVLIGATTSASPASASWSVQPSPNPPGSAGSTLSTVSCGTEGTCTAVGAYGVSGATLTLAEHRIGSTWTVESTPNPSGATFSDLTGLSCTGGRRCAAVGFSVSG